MTKTLISFRRDLMAAALACAALTAAPAAAQTYAPAITAPALGNVIPAASGGTTFRFTPAGAVTVTSGSGVRKSTGLVRGLVTLACSGGGVSGCANAIRVRVGSVGTPTGKAGALSNFTVAANVGVITTAASGTNPVEFQITPPSKSTNASFYFGADLPITGYDGAGAAGSAASGFYVYASIPSVVPSTGASSTASALTYRAVSFTTLSPTLKFGTIVRPSSGNTTVTLSPTTGLVTLSGTGTGSGQAGTTTAAAYTVSGEGGSAVSVTVPTSFAMNRAGGGAITTNLTPSTLPTLLSNSAGTVGTAGFTVGGNFTIGSGAVIGDYSGTYSVTVAYN